jgi:outer membrane biosynthesis protein TonB
LKPSELYQATSCASVIQASDAGYAEGVEAEVEPVEEPVDEPVVEPVDEPVVEPVDEPVEEPADEPVEEPVDEPVVEPVDEPVVEPVDEPVEEPVAVELPPLWASEPGVLEEGDDEPDDEPPQPAAPSARVRPTQSRIPFPVSLRG